MTKHFTYDGCRNPKAWVKIGDIYQATDDIYVRLHDEQGMHYTWHLYPGFQTDGGSVPLAFQWFVPKWSTDNDLINLAFSTVCWAVNNFAASHYGPENDRYDCKLFAELDVYSLK